ncbi:MAG: hypothetical protein Q8Q31_03940 [Nanoarchaeota archaeon]|nr:hypothetical protein [Nanoarchaeota archaeon]
MKIKEIKVEAIDEETGIILKRIVTDKGIFFSRKIAVSNTIYVCEKNRIKLNKSIIDTPFQTQHLEWNKSNEEWELTGLKKAKKHADQSNRFFIPFNQRNQSQWSSLGWDESFEDFRDLLRKTDIVPLYVPVTASLDELDTYKQKALSYLSKDQEIIIVLSTKHDIRHFPIIFESELKSSHFLGVSCYELTDSVELINVNFMKSLNAKLKLGQDCALIMCFNFPRVMSRHLQVAGSFAFTLFGGDVFSQRSNFAMDYEKLEDLKPEDIYCYDNKEKKFTKSNTQKVRYGFDITDGVITNIPVSEGLDWHQAIKFLSQRLQQNDLDLINDCLIQKQPLETEIKNYTGWNVFLDSISSQIPKTK